MESNKSENQFCLKYLHVFNNRDKTKEIVILLPNPDLVQR